MNIINFSPSRQIPWPTSHEWINKNIIKPFRIFPSHLGTTRSRKLIYFLLTQVKIVNKYNYCHCLDCSQSCLVPPSPPVEGWKISGHSNDVEIYICSHRSDYQYKPYICYKLLIAHWTVAGAFKDVVHASTLCYMWISGKDNGAEDPELCHYVM